MSFAYNYTTATTNSAQLAGVWSLKSRARRCFISYANSSRGPRSITAVYPDGCGESRAEENLARACNRFLIYNAAANARQRHVAVPGLPTGGRVCWFLSLLLHFFFLQVKEIAWVGFRLFCSGILVWHPGSLFISAAEIKDGHPAAKIFLHLPP